MTLDPPDSAARNQLASDWMHQGMDLAQENSTAALQKAVLCFDEAIALRRTLPLEENHAFRYGLSAGWINRGDALTRLSGSDLAEALRSYDEALALLESLPLGENVLYPRRLAITLINRGIALQKQETAGSALQAAQGFRKAIDVLNQPSAAAVADGPTLLAGAWTNLASVLVGFGEEDAATARSAANEALALVKSSERKEAVFAEMGLRARHTLCRLAVKDISDKKPMPQKVMAETTDAVDEGLALAEHWKFQEQADFAKLAREIFRFGCRIYETRQPHFLAEFLMEGLAPARFGGTAALDEATCDAVQATIWSALGNLQLKGFQFVATPQLEPYLTDIESLRKVEERLKDLRSQLIR